MNRLPVFATAFRIFFLACAVHAVAAITLWIFKLKGIEIATTNASSVFWHTYEMVFGFSRAAIFGFLFTAGQHWAGKFLLGGNSLIVLFLLWTIGRFAFFLPAGLAHIAFAADIAASVFALYRMRAFMNPQQKNNHNVVYLFIFFLLAQIGAVAALYVPQLADHFLHFVRLGLVVVVFFVALIAGRVLPFFASVVVPGEKPRILPMVEKIVWPMTLITLLSFAAIPLHTVLEKITAILFILAGTLHGVRWYYWKPFSTLKIPILAILYVGYFWFVAGFFMLAAALAGLLPLSPAWHMFGIGAAGVFIFGMITRVALGHTGRPIKASLLISAAYVMLNLALLIRVILPIAGAADRAYLYASVLWIASFMLYLIQYTPTLMRPRIDGKSG